MKVCIVSDSHDNHTLLKNAVRHAKAWGALAILHCGDVVASKTLLSLREFQLPIHVIHGNNMGDPHTMNKVANQAQVDIQYYGQDAALTLAERKIFLVHYPHYARALATTGDWDIVCCGHTHAAKISSVANIKGGETLMINPGTVGGVDAPATFILADLASMTFTITPVPEL